MDPVTTVVQWFCVSQRGQDPHLTDTDSKGWGCGDPVDAPETAVETSLSTYHQR